MKFTFIPFFSFLLLLSSVNASEATEKVWTEPVVVEPKYDGVPVAAPAGAVILFDGVDASKWKQLPRKEDADQTDRFRWKVENGYMEVVPRSGMISLLQPVITSGHLHIEWATPAEVKGNGQGRGNSGIFIGGFPELQVLDSYENKTYFDGQAGAFYKHRPPLVNACRNPGEWQCYDIHIERAKTAGPSVVTVYQNNVLVQDHEKFPGEVKAGLLQLQDHLNPVRFRNIWFKPAP
ncbi:MAG: DUF1080 domain-containing protein [Verrucomicrobiales bacterium]|nr:DUF1080 domain-containing protein [Verrucomicrobiales bacterium]MCP5558120.1 DUF1080 domain-containing protein [Verrucomicrobiaceae bacterium]